MLALGMHTFDYIVKQPKSLDVRKRLPPNDAVIIGDNYYFIANMQYDIDDFLNPESENFLIHFGIRIKIYGHEVMRITSNTPWPTETHTLESIIDSYKRFFDDTRFLVFPMSSSRESETLELGPRLFKTHDDYDVLISKYGIMIVYPFLPNYMKDEKRTFEVYR